MRSKHKKISSWGDPKETLDRRKFVRLGCLNVNGWSEQSRFDVLAAIELKNVDVFSLVETHSRQEDKERMEIPGFEVFQCKDSQAECGCGQSGDSSANRIIGGNIIAKNEYPWTTSP